MKNKRMKDQEAYAFCMQMALILKTGIPILDGLQVIDNTDMDTILLSQLREEVSLGHSLSQALKTVDCFDHYVINIIEVGEKSGNLDEVMEALTTYFQRNIDIKEKVKETISYPFFLTIIMLAVIGIIIIKVLPIFQNVLHAIGSELTPLAKTLMNIGTIIGQYGFYIAIIVVIGFILLAGYIYFLQRKKGNSGDPFDNFLFKRLKETIALSRLTYALNLMLSSGYDIQEALTLLPGLVHNTSTLKKLESCQEAIARGDRIEEALMNSKLYEGIYAKMLYVGFKSGNGENVLSNIATLCQEDINNTTIRYLNIVEPAMVVTLSIIIGIILMSVMLPLISIMTTIS